MRYYVEYPSLGFGYCFSQDLASDIGIVEKDHSGEVPFSSHHVKGSYYQCNLSLLM